MNQLGRVGVFERAQVLGEVELPQTAELVAEGSRLAGDWQVVPGAFLSEHGVASEAEFKRRMMAEGKVCQHAQIGFRDPARTKRAMAEVHAACARRDAPLVRYGICLDWVMGLPRDRREGVTRGTGLILDGVEDLVAVANAAPVAPHFGDFIMGFPASVENTCAALAAGATAVGNLGQYFSFRLPGWDDDVASTTATVTALSLLAHQEAEVLVHSNLDDGFASMFDDLASVLGLAMVEKYIVEDLLGARLSHCWGHHFSDPLRRFAFHLALSEVNGTPGTMIYGNTVSYQGSTAENFASLASYLGTDIAGQMLRPSGHAINPVPVSENSRIPDIDEIIDAQLFAARLGSRMAANVAMIDMAVPEEIAGQLVVGAEGFKARLMAGFAGAGIRTGDAVEMLLTLRRLGGSRLNRMFGAPAAVVPSPQSEEIAEMARVHFARVGAGQREVFAARRPRLMVATSDVHEHAKRVLDEVLVELGAEVLDGGVSVDAGVLAVTALEQGADAILLSTYNGVALAYFSALKAALADAGSDMPVLIGGRLNQIPEGSNTSLPVNVTDELRAAGAIVCDEVEDAIPAVLGALGR